MELQKKKKKNCPGGNVIIRIEPRGRRTSGSCTTGRETAKPVIWTARSYTFHKRMVWGKSAFNQNKTMRKSVDPY
jgi:hypothetical protein